MILGIEEHEGSQITRQHCALDFSRQFTLRMTEAVCVEEWDCVLKERLN